MYVTKHTLYMYALKIMLNDKVITVTHELLRLDFCKNTKFIFITLKACISMFFTYFLAYRRKIYVINNEDWSLLIF